MQLLSVRTLASLLLLLTLSACSLHRYQGADDQLYIGIRSIDVTDRPRGEYASDAIAEAEDQLAYAPNSAIFGSSSLRWPFPLVSPYVYMRLSGDSTILSRALRRFTSAPVWMRDVSPQLRAKVAQQTLWDNGFLAARVSSEILPLRGDSLQARVRYQMNLGHLYTLDSISYFPNVYIRSGRAFRHQRLSPLQRGVPFAKKLLEEDRSRVQTFLRQHGYYYLKPEHIAYQADTLRKPGQVELRTIISPSTPPEALRQWRIGRIHLRQLPSEGSTSATRLMNDSVVLADSIVYHYAGRRSVRPRVMLPRLWLYPNRLYDQRDEERTLQALSALSAFASVDLYFSRSESTSQSASDSISRAVSATADSLSGDSTARRPLMFTSAPDSIGTLDLTILLRRDKPWSTYLGAAFMRKSTNFIGPGLATSLERTNVFGGGERLSANLSGSYEWQTGRNPDDGYAVSINSYQLGADLSLSFPSILFPRMMDRYYRYPTSTNFKVGWQILNHARFYTLRSLSFTMDYSFQTTEAWSHRLTPLSLNYTQLARITDRFNTLLANNPALGLSLRNQLIPKVSYAFTYRYTPEESPHNLQLTGEVSEAGNLTNLAWTALRRSYDETKTILGVPFAQYAKVALDLRYAYRIDRNQTLATHFATGAIYSYGNARTAPYIEQFYVGGANSIRAFTVRSLGPGSYRPSQEGAYAFMDRVGEFKLEGNVEYRGRLFGNCYGALFLDAGNVWLLRPDADRPGAALSEAGSLGRFLDQVAVGTGAGVRYDLSFLIVRFDVGVGLHLPYETSRRGWYNIPRFRDALGLHLAIGYPF